MVGWKAWMRWGAAGAVGAAACLAPLAGAAGQAEPAPAAEPFEVALSPRAGGIEVVGRSYRALVGADGNLHSLVVGETEMLDDGAAVSRGMYFYSDAAQDPGAPARVGDRGVRAGQGTHSVGYEFEPDEIVITLRHESPTRTSFFAVLTREMVIAEDLDSHALATTPATQPWGTVRFTASSGSILTLRGGSRIWGPWLGRQVWEVADVPRGRDVRLVLVATVGEPPQPTLGQLIGLEVALAQEDHLVPAGSRAEIEVSLENRSDQPLQGEIALSVGEPGRGRVAQFRQAVARAPAAGGTVAFAASAPRPGFYDATASLLVEEVPIKRASASFGYGVEQIAPSASRPDDFDAYWGQVVAEVEAAPAEAELAPDAERTDEWVTVSRLTLRGAHEDGVSGWFCLPREGEGLPGILLLPGYMAKHIAPPVALARRGYAVLAIGVPGADVAAPQAPQPYITEGLEEPARYVYRTLCADSLRALQWLAGQPRVDRARLAVSGPGQGGAVALILAAISPDLAAAMCDVPLFCDLPRALETARWPTSEIAKYIDAHPESEAQIRGTLGYFDLAHHAPKVKAPVLMSIGLRDRVCPPATAYAVFNALSGPRQIKVYATSGHEAGGSRHWGYKLEWLEQTLRPASPHASG